MKRIIAISDNHGNSDIVNKILSKEDYNLSIHLGDSENTKQWAESLFDYAVEGNNDFNGLPLEIKFEYEGLNFLILHGHTRGIYVHNWKKEPLNVAKTEGVEVLVHGHSHIPYVIQEGSITTMCPGSTTIPRSEFGVSYAILEIENKKVKVILKSALI